MYALRLLGLTVVLSLASSLLLMPCPARACATAWLPNKPDAIADETAIILWDAATKTQHFIRSASFRTGAPDFGFLVPTPTRPTLAEAGDEAFALLAKITAPVVVDKPRPSNPGCGIGCSSPPGYKAASSKVDVLAEKHVAGYNAAVLAANDATALGDWLREHGYDFPPELVDWAGVYARAGWIVTAFKVARVEPDAPRAATSAVRMSFSTEHPFFPYREPARQPGASSPGESRMQPIYFLGQERMQGAQGFEGDGPWPGKTVWANRVSDADREQILKALVLPGNTRPESWYLTEFEDESSPRPGSADLFFSRSENQKPVAREPYVRYVSAGAPDCVMGYALATFLFLPLFTRRFRRNGQGVSCS